MTHNPHPTPWRQGRKVPRNIYDANDQPIVMMPDEESAGRVVEGVNGYDPDATRIANRAMELGQGMRKAMDSIENTIGDEAEPVAMQAARRARWAWEEFMLARDAAPPPTPEPGDAQPVQCAHREWTAEDHHRAQQAAEDPIMPVDVEASGPQCPERATHLSCDPKDTPHCAEHACRCKKPIGKPPPTPADAGDEPKETHQNAINDQHTGHALAVNSGARREHSDRAAFSPSLTSYELGENRQPDEPERAELTRIVETAKRSDPGTLCLECAELALWRAGFTRGRAEREAERAKLVAVGFDDADYIIANREALVRLIDERWLQILELHNKVTDLESALATERAELIKWRSAYQAEVVAYDVLEKELASERDALRNTQTALTNALDSGTRLKSSSDALAKRVTALEAKLSTVGDAWLACSGRTESETIADYIDRLEGEAVVELDERTRLQSTLATERAELIKWRAAWQAERGAVLRVERDEARERARTLETDIALTRHACHGAADLIVVRGWIASAIAELRNLNNLHRSNTERLAALRAAMTAVTECESPRDMLDTAQDALKADSLQSATEPGKDDAR